MYLERVLKCKSYFEEDGHSSTLPVIEDQSEPINIDSFWRMNPKQNRNKAFWAGSPDRMNSAKAATTILSIIP
jgi:hypothetical protein